MADALTAGTDRPSRIRVIVPLGFHQILAWGSSYYLLTVLAAPIARDTGWPLVWITSGFSIGLISSGLVSPSVGRAIVRWGGARVLASGSILLSLGLIALAASPSLPFFVLSWTILGAGMGCALYDAAFSTLGQLYGSEARRPITTLTLFGGFASTICWPLSAFLVESFGWREACFFYAAIHLLVSAPALLFFLPRGTDAKTRSEEARPAAPGHRGLFLLTLIFITASAIFAIVSIHLLTFLQALGFALAAAVALGTLVGPSQVGARIIEILFGSRYHPIWTLVTAAVLICAGILLLYFGFPITAACLVLYGAGNGIWSISRGTVPLALFGADHFPAIMGRLAKAAFLSQAAAPFLAAQIIAGSGEHAALAALALLAILNLGLVLLLGARVLPRQDKKKGAEAPFRQS